MKDEKWKVKSKEVNVTRQNLLFLFFDHDKRKMMTFGKGSCELFFKGGRKLSAG